MIQWPAKDPAENVLLRFMFNNQLEANDTIQSATITVVNVATGADASAIKSGAYQVVGTDVLQATEGGPDGDYYWRCLATTALGRKLLVDAELPIRTPTGTPF